MAILYGTTADGDSLPVEVNEFGQLVAQGLQGQEGPPGPPGLPELPPDPFEGAILGWKDNTLSWLGGTVPLPEGTYGPIIAYENGVLTLQSSINLPYLAAIFLSDDLGQRYSYQLSTSAITRVVTTQVVLDIAGVSTGTYSVSFDFAKKAFDGSTSTFFGFDTGGLYPNGGANWKFNTPIRVQTLELTGAGGVNEEGGSVRFTDGTNQGVGDGKVTYSEPKFIESMSAGSGGTWQNWSNISGIKRDDSFLIQGQTVVSTNKTLFLADDTNLSGFRVGDVVADGVVIVSIDDAAPSITTDGGDWIVGESVVSPVLSGEGTVQSTTASSIILRENNDQWLVGKYVTAPEQNLAARYVYSEQLKNKLL